MHRPRAPLLFRSSGGLFFLPVPAGGADERTNVFPSLFSHSFVFLSRARFLRCGYWSGTWRPSAGSRLSRTIRGSRRPSRAEVAPGTPSSIPTGLRIKCSTSGTSIKRTLSLFLSICAPVSRVSSRLLRFLFSSFRERSFSSFNLLVTLQVRACVFAHGDRVSHSLSPGPFDAHIRRISVFIALRTFCRCLLLFLGIFKSCRAQLLHYSRDVSVSFCRSADVSFQFYSVRLVFAFLAPGFSARSQSLRGRFSISRASLCFHVQVCLPRIVFFKHSPLFDASQDYCTFRTFSFAQCIASKTRTLR